MVTGHMKDLNSFAIRYAVEQLGSLLALQRISRRDGPPSFKTMKAMSLSSSEGRAR